MQDRVTRNDGWWEIYAASAGGLLDELDRAAFDATARCAVVAIDNAADPLTGAQFERLIACELPLVTVVAGELTAAQADLAVAADVRVGERGLRFPRPEHGLERLRLLLRERSDLFAQLWQSVPLHDDAALAGGLIGALVAPGAGRAEAVRIAGLTASRGPIATRLGKEAVWRGLAMPLEQALRFETDLTLILQTTHDRAEGVRAFLEKRPPAFNGA